MCVCDKESTFSVAFSIFLLQILLTRGLFIWFSFRKMCLSSTSSQLWCSGIYLFILFKFTFHSDRIFVTDKRQYLMNTSVKCFPANSVLQLVQRTRGWCPGKIDYQHLLSLKMLLWNTTCTLLHTIQFKIDFV